MNALVEALTRALGGIPKVNLEGASRIGNVVLDSQKGIGASGVNSNINYLGLGMFMKPSEFLNLNPERNYAMESASYLRKRLEQGSSFGPPSLQTLYNKDAGIMNVVGHEGRTRSAIMNSVQPELAVPVHVEMRRQISPQDQFGAEMRSRHIDPEQVLRSIVTPDRMHGAKSLIGFKPRVIVHNGRSYFMGADKKMMDVTDILGEG
jgi:hypothetical protein